MTVEAIPENELVYLDMGLRGIIGRDRNGGEEPTNEELDGLRSTLRVVQQQTFGLEVL
jgi:hypothetical protein